VIRGICDTERRVPARIYVAIWLALDRGARRDSALPDCPCCSFWRGALLAWGVAVVLLALYAFLKG
jgi:hypothetical protein